MQQGHESASHDGVGAISIVATDIGAPEVRETRWFGPQAHELMIVVRKDDPPSGTNGPQHVAHDAERIADVLEHEARVSDVEGSPLSVGEAAVEHVSTAKIGQALLAIRCCETLGALELQVILLQTDDGSSRDGARHSP